MGWLFGRRKAQEEVRPGFRQRPQEEWTDAEFDVWFDGLTEREQWAQWDKWSLETYDHPTVRAIQAHALDMGLEAAKASYPQEFGCMVRVVKGVITELVLVPGTIQGDRHAIFQFGNLPVDRSIQGTLHSHPSPHPYPSDADFALFEKHGTIHLILGRPFGPDDWRAYDHSGTPVHLDVLGSSPEEHPAGSDLLDPLDAQPIDPAMAEPALTEEELARERADAEEIDRLLRDGP